MLLLVRVLTASFKTCSCVQYYGFDYSLEFSFNLDQILKMFIHCKFSGYILDQRIH